MTTCNLFSRPPLQNNTSLRFATHYSSHVSLLLLLALLCLPAPASAAIYKCVNLAGGTTYTNTPCAHDESTQRISSTAATIPGQDCRIARKFSYDTTRRMKQGETSAQIFETYGGINSISPLVIGLINYIYTFQKNDKVSDSRIASLATERCQVGSFGVNARRCEIYPNDFIQALGGCDAARSDTTSSKPMLTEQTGNTTATEPTINSALPADPQPSK